MKVINNESLLHAYVKKYKIEDLFETDMTPYMRLVSYSRNEPILVAGDPLPYFYFIVDGKAKIYKRLENGKTVLLRFTRPLSELGSLELLHKERFVDTEVASLYDTVCIQIPFDKIESLCDRDVTFYKYIIDRLSHKLETSSRTASINYSYPFKNRFASYLISITRLSEVERIDEINFNKLTELATYLGTSYRHLNRTIKEFEDEGIIEKTNNKFIIMNFEKLEDLSGDYYE